MPAAIYTVGKTTIRDLLKTGFSPSIGLSDDSAAFAVGQTSVNPTGGATTALVKTATIADVDASTYDATISVNGTTELTGKNIYSISACTSNSAAAAKSRTVRSNPIGVQTGDLYTIGLRIAVADNS
jgi:hypothetical protein